MYSVVSPRRVLCKQRVLMAWRYRQLYAISSDSVQAHKFACWFRIWYLKNVQESSPSGLQLYDQQAN